MSGFISRLCKAEASTFARTLGDPEALHRACHAETCECPNHKLPEGEYPARGARE